MTITGWINAASSRSIACGDARTQVHQASASPRTLDDGWWDAPPKILTLPTAVSWPGKRRNPLGRSARFGHAAEGRVINGNEREAVSAFNLSKDGRCWRVRLLSDDRRRAARRMSFMVAYIRTSRLILLRPRQVASRALNDDLADLSQPFTYLAVSAFAASFAIHYQGLEFVYSASVKGVQSELSATHLLTTTLPSVALVVLAGWVLASVVGVTPARSRHIVELVCYAAGFQCLAIFVVSLGVAAYFARK